jgi:hypothetical protein
MKLESWRIATWLVVAWTLLFCLLVIGDLAGPQAQGALEFFVTARAPVSLRTWAIGTVLLGLLWYATRPRAPRVRILAAVLAGIAILSLLLAAW